MFQWDVHLPGPVLLSLPVDWGEGGRFVPPVIVCVPSDTCRLLTPAGGSAPRRYSLHGRRPCWGRARVSAARVRGCAFSCSGRKGVLVEQSEAWP